MTYSVRMRSGVKPSDALSMPRGAEARYHPTFYCPSRLAIPEAGCRTVKTRVS